MHTSTDALGARGTYTSGAVVTVSCEPPNTLAGSLEEQCMLSLLSQISTPIPLGPQLSQLSSLARHPRVLLGRKLGAWL